MTIQNFNDLVKKYFAYLDSDLGFSIREEIPVTGHPLSHGMVVYESSLRSGGAENAQLLVRIILDRGYVLADFGTFGMDVRDFFGMTEILQVLAPELAAHEKLDLSKEPDEIIEPQIIRLSGLVLKFCKPFLEGNFSIAEEVIKGRLKAKEERIRSWKKRVDKS